MRNILHIIIGLLLLAGGSAVNAQVQLQRSSPQDNTDREQQRLGIQYYQNRDYEKSLAIFTELYGKDENHVNYTYYLNSLLELREYREAEKLAKRHARKHSGQLRYQIDIGFVYIRASEREKAQKKFDEVIDRLPASLSEIKMTANMFYTRGQTDYAIEAYRKGKELLDGEYSFDLELATMFERNGNYPDMVESYLDYLSENPNGLESVKNKLQSALSRDIENSLPDILREGLLVRYQDNPEEVYLNELLLWLSIQQKDFDFAFIQARSLDRRFNEEGYRVLELAELALANKAYEAAHTAYQYILDKGKDAPLYLNGLIGFLETRYLQISDNIRFEEAELLELEAAYAEALDEFGIHQQTIRLLRDLAHIQAFHLGKEAEAIENLQMAIDVPGPESVARAQSKLELADIYLFMGEVWEATLLYSQVEKAFKNEPIGHEAKLKNARLTYYIGEFEWARAQLDVLKAATSKLIANDALELSMLISDNVEADSSYRGLRYYSAADLLLYQNKPDEALKMLDSVVFLIAWHPLSDEVQMKKAQIRIMQERYAEADSLLQRITTAFPDDILGDDALFTRAKLQEEIFEDSQKAMELYQELLSRYPGSIYTIEARKRFRKLRGDGV